VTTAAATATGSLAYATCCVLPRPLFRDVTPVDYEFANVFEERSREYERLVLAKADTEDMPDQEPVHRKSKAVIVHQLMKRWRNIRFDKRETRRPPSAMMAKLTADAANSTETLSEELLHQARAVRDELNQWHGARLLVHVVNPACAEDVLTDRWPGSLYEQAALIADLDDLVAKAERLVAGCSLEEMRAIMTDLFGEEPTGQAFRAFNARAGAAIREGRSQYTPGSGRLSLAASGIVAGVAAPSVARAAPRNTFFGTERRKP
jgi:hypothetical protein